MFLKSLLRKNRLVCNKEIKHKLFSKKNYTYREMDHIIAYAIADSLKNYPETTVLDSESRLVISEKSILAGIESNDVVFSMKSEDSILDNIEFENEFEKRLAEDVIPKNEINVTFDDIGALENVKQVLKELVMLPLQRPELFRGNLVKPCKGILLFGPPGTGKTMLAKAIATESGANFLNIPMSSLTSKWFGDAEKYTKAVFTLASKLSPCVVFIDEVDSFLGQRGKDTYEHEVMRKMKNEFMASWDGLKSKENERILILAATNRPFDLDEAVLRRMPRRLLVDLPDAENREKIFKVILSKENLDDDVDFKELAAMTDGYSGSDIKNLCIEAAHEPIRDYIKNEKKSPKKEEEVKSNEESYDDDDDDDDESYNQKRELDPPLRKIKMDDFRAAKKKISPSVQENSKSFEELRAWNERYGEGGSRAKFTPSYFM